MAVFRIERTKDYTVMSNHHLRNHELFEVLLSDYRSYEELRLTKGCREVTEEDERQAEILCQSFRERWKEEEK